MSRPRHPADWLPGDPSGDFGRDEGLVGYAILANMHPDATVVELAKQAVQIGMVVHRRFDINSEQATQAVVKAITPDPLRGDQ